MVLALTDSLENGVILEAEALRYGAMRHLILVRVDVLAELGADQAEQHERHILLASYAIGRSDLCGGTRRANVAAHLMLMLLLLMMMMNQLHRLERIHSGAAHRRHLGQAGRRRLQRVHQ